MVDLTTVEGVQSYLSQTPFAASRVTPLSGGTGNFTYRIHLREPYNDAVLQGQVHTLIFKHAAPYLPGNKSFAFAVERQDFESLAFKHIQQLIFPSVPAVSVPRLYFEDSEQRAILMSDSGEASITLKALLQTTPPANEDSHLIGHSLGTFLARLHNSTSYNGSPGSEVKGIFEANQQGRVISSLVTYGRIIDTISPPEKGPIFVEPPLNVSPAEIETVATLAKTMQDHVMTSRDVLTMGDFWPGNLLVTLAQEPHVDIVDWELAKPGLAGLDIGQFLAEMSLLRVFHPSSRASVDITVSSFLRGYRDTVLGDGAAKQNLTDVARVAATHMGAHLVAWTPRTPWGSKEQTRAVVMDGLEYILRVPDCDEAWLRTSLVGGLLP